MAIKRSQLYQDYWTQLQQYIRLQDNGVRPFAATSNPWMMLEIKARPAFEFVAYNYLNDSLYNALRIDGTHAEDFYGKLHEERDAIEHELGCELDWVGRRYEGNRYLGYDIYCVLRDADLADQKRWPEYIAWQSDMALHFKKCFKPRVKMLAVALGDIYD